jgi:hypothetical protein
VSRRQAVLRSAMDDRQSPNSQHVDSVRSTLIASHTSYHAVYPVTGTFLCSGSCCALCVIPSPPHGDLGACCCKYPAGRRNRERRTPVLRLRRRSCSYALYLWCSTQTAATPTASVVALHQQTTQGHRQNIVSQSRGKHPPRCALQDATVRSGCLKRASSFRCIADVGRRLAKPTIDAPPHL